MLVGVLMLKLKKGLYKYIRVRAMEGMKKLQILDEFLGRTLMLLSRAIFNRMS